MKYTVDKRGRPVKHTTNENLKKFYDLSDSGSSSESGDAENDDDDDDGDEEVRRPTIKEVPKAEEADYARGEAIMESSSDDEDDDDNNEEDVVDDDGFDHNWGELDKSVPEADEISCRLAVCNMDWDWLKADDIFVLLNSFIPPGGSILSVRIYPSEYGVKRMKEEAMSGPSELKDLKKDSDMEEPDEGEDEAEENPYSREKLREYQLNRLKYFYAVAEFDSKKTSNAVYEECDGMEYQTSATKIDLRFVPDGMTFDQSVKSECTSLPDASVYKPPTFLTTALCQTKVNLTWDETDHDRLKVTMRKFDKKGDVNEDDFKAYLASSSENEDPDYDKLIAQSDLSDQSSNEDEQIEKYRDLLKGIDDSENKNDMNMEIEWEPGLKDTAKDIVKNKEKSKDMTPWKQFQEKKKEKKRQKREERKQKRDADKAAGLIQTFSDDELPDGLGLDDEFFTDEIKRTSKTSKKKGKKKRKEEKTEETEKNEAELSLLLMDENGDGKQHFNLGNLMDEGKKKKKKKKDKSKPDAKVEDDFELDVKDSRFDAIFSSHHFNIDPSAPEFKKTKGMDTLIEEKLKRRAKDSSLGPNKKSPKVDSKYSESIDSPREQSLTSLLKSVKSKTQQFQAKKTKRKV